MKFKNRLQHLLTIALLVTVSTVALGQVPHDYLEPKTLPANPPRVILPEGAKMQTILYEAEQFAREIIPFEILELLEDVHVADLFPLQVRDVQDELERRGISFREDGRVNVEIIGPQGEPAVDEQLILDFEGILNGQWRHRRDVWVPIEQLTALSQRLPEGYFMERVAPPKHDGPEANHSQGPDVINSISYINGGANGAGRTIAVIDSGYNGLTVSRNAGHSPPLNQTTQINYTSNPFESGTTHGTGCTEAAFAHAPGSLYRLYRIGSMTHFGMAVDNAIANNTNIITHSLSRYNQGWADNSGDACAIANTAANAGLLFFTSAGNRACQHWQGTMNPGANSWHNFSGSDQTIAISLPPGAGGGFYLQWNTAGGTHNYDLYLWDANIQNVLASSTNSGNTFESFSWTNNSGSTQIVHLAVLKVSGSNVPLELFFHSSGCGTCTECNFQHIVSASSITSPSNSTHANVISNAAVPWQSFDSPNGTGGIIASYSSRGPSNGNATRPDLSGPTNTATFCCGAFGGTSSATPNNAGAAAAFWSSRPQFNSTAVRWLMYEQARLFKDWGAAGKDNIYGFGGSILVDYVPGTVWLSRNYGNTSNAHTGPYYTAQAAYNNVPNNGRILIFPGGTYPETFLSGAKAVLVETVHSQAVLGSQ